MKAGVPGEIGRDAGGNHGIRGDEGLERVLRHGGFEADFVQVDGDVSEDESDVDEGVGARRIEVFERNEHFLRVEAE